MMAATASPRATADPTPTDHAPAVDFSLRDRIREYTSDEADPRNVAQRVIDTLTADEMRAALTTTLPDYVRNVTRPTRMHGRVSTRSEKWTQAAEIRGEIAVLRGTVFACGEWKFLGDCDADDCTDIAVHRAESARENSMWAKRYRDAAKALKKHNVATVRELPAEVVEEIFNA